MVTLSNSCFSQHNGSFITFEQTHNSVEFDKIVVYEITSH